MFDFKCLFCNESMPFATSKGYHKVCARALREIEVPVFSLDKAWLLEVSEEIEEDNTTIDMGADPTYELSADEDSWDTKTELITYQPRELAANQ